MPISTEKYRSTDISGDYAAMARAFGGYGERVTKPRRHHPGDPARHREDQGRHPGAAGVHHLQGNLRLAPLTRRGHEAGREPVRHIREAEWRRSTSATCGRLSAPRRSCMASASTIEDGAVRRPGRPVGLRQVHAAAHARRAREHHRRRDRDRRAGGQRRAAQGPRHRHGVPELRALSAHDRVREHGLLA